MIFLSSRLHPDGTGDVTPLRARVATIAAAALIDAPPLDDSTSLRIDRHRLRRRPPNPAASGAGTPTTRVLTGIDVLARDGFALLKGRKVGLVTNHTGRAARRRADDRPAAQGAGRDAGGALQPRARHPRRARRRGRAVVEGRERPACRSTRSTAKRGAPRRRCSQGIDTLVVDLQDIGARFYTYPTTMGYVMEEAAKRKIKVVVLDRPNPIGGWQIEGPLRRRRRSLELHRLHADADPPRHDARRAGAALQRRAKIGADLDGRARSRAGGATSGSTTPG